MPTYSQLKKPAGTGACLACLKAHQPLYLFSQQGGIVARTGRSTEGSFAKEERELRKPVVWSSAAFCSYTCFLRGSPTPKAQVWRLIRVVQGNLHEVSRHTTEANAAKALASTTALCDSQFFVEGP